MLLYHSVPDHLDPVDSEKYSILLYLQTERHRTAKGLAQ